MSGKEARIAAHPSASRPSAARRLASPRAGRFSKKRRFIGPAQWGARNHREV